MRKPASRYDTRIAASIRNLVSSTLRRVPVVLCVVFVLTSLGFSQQALVTITASHITDPAGNVLTNGTWKWQPTDCKSNPYQYHVGGGGFAIARPVVGVVVNGASTQQVNGQTLKVLDTSATNPVNACFDVTIVDANTMRSFPVIKNVQPAYSNSWCTAGVCNFDNYVPPLLPLPLFQVQVSGTLTPGNCLQAVTASTVGTTNNPCGTSTGGGVTSVTVTTLAAGAQATATLANGVLALGIPQGATGGAITSVNVTMLSSGSQPTASISNGVLSLGIPQAASSGGITSATVTMLSAGSQPTASVSNGVLALGIPSSGDGNVLYGAADPSSANGSNGDYWYNTTSGCLRGPKASGAWPGTCLYTLMVQPNGALVVTGDTTLTSAQYTTILANCSSTCHVYLPATIASATWAENIVSIGTASALVAPAGGSGKTLYDNANTAQASIPLLQRESLAVWTDGTNYYSDGQSLRAANNLSEIAAAGSSAQDTARANLGLNAASAAAASGTKCYPYQGSSGSGCDTPSSSSSPGLLTAYGGVGDSTTDNSTAMTSACAANSVVLLQSGAFAFTVNYTVPCPIVIGDNATIVVSSGKTLTLYSMDAPDIQVFTGAGTVKFNDTQDYAYPEWWGAKADGSLSATTGTDNTAYIQAAYNALSSGDVRFNAGVYKTTSALTFNKSGVSLDGVSSGSKAGQGALATYVVPGTWIVSSSSSADIVDLGGTSGSPTTSVDITDVSFTRSVAPSAGSYGVKAQYVNYLRTKNLWTMNSATNRYYLGCNNAFEEFPEADWTISGGATTGLIGFLLDTNSSFQNASIRLNWPLAVNHLGSSYHATGIKVQGAQIRDHFFDRPETAGLDYGFDIEAGSATTAGYATDIHILKPVIDNAFVSCILVNGLSDGTPLGYVGIDGGYCNGNGLITPLIDIESSSGVTLYGAMQIESLSGTSTTGIYINGGGSNTITLPNVKNIKTAVSLNSTNKNTVIGVQHGSPSGSTSSSIALTAATSNTFVGNVLKGYNTNGISANSTSCSNKFFGNIIDTTNITTATSDSCSGTANLWDGGGGGGLSGLTPNNIPYAATSSSLAPSPLFYSGGNVNTSAPINNASGSRITTSHFIGNSATPTYAAGTTIGTGPTVTITGTDFMGDISITTGTSASGTGTMLTMTFGQAWTNLYGSILPHCVVVQQGGASVGVDRSTTSTTLTLTNSSTLSSSTTYKFSYTCGG